MIDTLQWWQALIYLDLRDDLEKDSSGFEENSTTFSVSLSSALSQCLIFNLECQNVNSAARGCDKLEGLRGTAQK